MIMLNTKSPENRLEPTSHHKGKAEGERCLSFSDDSWEKADVVSLPMVPQYLKKKNLVRGLNGMLLRGPSG